VPMVAAMFGVLRLFVEPCSVLATKHVEHPQGSVCGLEDAAVLIQGAISSKPSSLGERVKHAIQGVDPSDIVGAIGAIAKMASPMQQQQWSLGGGFSQPMFQQLQPAGFGQPAFQQMQPTYFGQGMFQQRPPMYNPMQQFSMPWQMQTRPMGGGASFFMAPFGGLNAEDAAQRMQQRAQAAKEAAEGAMVEGLARVKQTSKRRARDLAMVHVPCNFGHTIEKAALMSQDNDELYVDPSFTETDKTRQQMYINMAQGPGGEAWGMMAPDLRQISEKTGCDLYYTPQVDWPEAVAKKYFRFNRHENRTVFGMLRDPYDKIVNEFRMQVVGVSSLFAKESRKAISEREGTMDRESDEYQRYYDTCNVSAWVKAELTKYKNGSRFRGNCHLLPQAEYFKGINGISIPIDNRLIPQSFNEVMKNHGYEIRMGLTYHNYKCEISAWNLDDEAKSLVREVYADDFDLVCKHFGYCDKEELTCIKQVSHMCGGSPHAD